MAQVSKAILNHPYDFNGFIIPIKMVTGWFTIALLTLFVTDLSMSMTLFPQ
jgi:hypothetical protein